MNTYEVEFPSYDGDTFVVRQPAISPAAAIFTVAAHYGHLKAYSGSYSVSEISR